MEKAFSIRREVLGEKHPETADSYNNMAGVYEKEGRYEEAEKLYETAIGIYEEVLGKKHPITAVSYENLAYLYIKLGRDSEAEKLFRKAGKTYIQTSRNQQFN